MDLPTASPRDQMAESLDRVSRPKLLHVTTTDMSLELLLGPQLHAFAEAGYEVVGASAPGPYSARLEAAGIRHVPLRHATRSMAPRADVAATLEMYRLFRRERPDIVHLHNPKPGWFGRPAAAAARIPVIVNTVHGLYTTEGDRFWFRNLVYGLERFAAIFSGAELVQNPEDVERLLRLRVPRDRVITLGNGIDLERFSPDRPDPKAVAEFRSELGVGGDDVLVGAVGRLVWGKGLRELFDAARLLQTRCPRARMVVVGPVDHGKGDGLTEADLRRIESDSGVVFVGERMDMDVVYAALDIYVLASYREGFPRSAMEASAMGTPVLATNIRGCRQVVEHGRTGLLFPVRNTEALANAVVRAVEDDEARQRWGRAAVAKARAEFDQQRVIDVTLEVYERLLARRRS